MIPAEIISDLESEAAGLTHGIVTLQLHIRDSNLARYTINREKSVLTPKLSVGGPCNTKNYETKKEK